ncbi:putative holin-like toxin [Siminovitchia fortis]
MRDCHLMISFGSLIVAILSLLLHPNHETNNSQ